MNQNLPDILLMILFLAAVGILFGVNYYYQRKAGIYTDELLRFDPLEFNKQIRGNAYRKLFSSFIWALLVLTLFFWKFESLVSGQMTAIEVVLLIIEFAFGVILVFFGVYGYRNEMKRLIELT
jgi:sterol desaturase/sphingolipid hydroxylase (fatty acid hydroxylase superfamily)